MCQMEKIKRKRTLPFINVNILFEMLFVWTTIEFDHFWTTILNSINFTAAERDEEINKILQSTIT